MNETTDPITNLEKRALLVFTLVPLLFFLAGFAEAAIRENRSSISKPGKITFAVDDPSPSMPAGMDLLIVPIFVSLIRPRSFLVPMFLAVSYAGLLLLSFYIRVDGESFLGGPIPGDPGFFGELYLKTWVYDYVALIFLVVFLPWLFSIIYRKAQSRSRETAQP